MVFSSPSAPDGGPVSATAGSVPLRRGRASPPNSARRLRRCRAAASGRVSASSAASEGLRNPVRSDATADKSDLAAEARNAADACTAHRLHRSRHTTGRGWSTALRTRKDRMSKKLMTVRRRTAADTRAAARAEGQLRLRQDRQLRYLQDLRAQGRDASRTAADRPADRRGDRDGARRQGLHQVGVESGCLRRLSHRVRQGEGHLDLQQRLGGGYGAYGWGWGGGWAGARRPRRSATS